MHTTITHNIHECAVWICWRDKSFSFRLHVSCNNTFFYCCCYCCWQTHYKTFYGGIAQKQCTQFWKMPMYVIQVVLEKWKEKKRPKRVRLKCCKKWASHGFNKFKLKGKLTMVCIWKKNSFFPFFCLSCICCAKKN